MADIEPDNAKTHLIEALNILRGLQEQERLNPMDLDKIAALEQRLEALAG